MNSDIFLDYYNKIEKEMKKKIENAEKYMSFSKVIYESGCRFEAGKIIFFSLFQLHNMPTFFCIV
jgi:membrane-bound inhibitor of C-type lysozyme